ncbi:MAG: hypothetical protein ACYSTR_07890 [Planctomycetota bacterium]|jgi:hypothetical protein
MSRVSKVTFLLSVFAVVGLMFLLSGCNNESKTACCGQPGAKGCCVSAEAAHSHSHGEVAKCCGSDPSKCCGKKAAEAKVAKCCGNDPTKCCGSKK